jgi:hypothetical protein
MSTKPAPKANVLGDLRAEADHVMLDKAFYVSPDYRSIIEHGDCTVIVGRRGTGKSALLYRLKKHWESSGRTQVITIAPEDYETIGLYGALAPFANRLTLVRAAAKLGWRYALLMEIASALKKHFKFAQIGNIPMVTAELREWNARSDSVPNKMKLKLDPLLKEPGSPEQLIGNLANRLQLNSLQNEVVHCLSTIDQNIYILIDRLDEGYEANELGIGLIDGFLHASMEINNALPNAKAFIFLRDNIFRAIAKHDPDYSRQIEGEVIRLHWDEYHLFNLTANRLRQAFGFTDEASVDVWDQVTCRKLVGREGFRYCLRLTLYRPRDLLALLNKAFYHSYQHGRKQISEDDIEHSANEISESRFSDLLKEYEAIFPGLDKLTRVFANGSGHRAAEEVRELIIAETDNPALSPAEAQHFRILGPPDGCIQALYSIGFIGVKDSTSGRFKFCHDGNQTKFDILPKTQFLVHPCYWRALNIHDHELTAESIEDLPPALVEIHDEYDIEVKSETPEIRKHRLGQIISALPLIPEGDAGAHQFEDWCQQAISILFAGALAHVEAKPNKDATQRRDIVARNKGSTDAWKRILEDYKVRQVIFEVKNYRDLGTTEYRQMNSYLVREYGLLGFIITREEDESLLKDKDLAWVKEIYFEHRKLIVKLTGTWLSKYLSRARSAKARRSRHRDQRVDRPLSTQLSVTSA